MAAGLQIRTLSQDLPNGDIMQPAHKTDYQKLRFKYAAGAGRLGIRRLVGRDRSDAKNA